MSATVESFEKRGAIYKRLGVKPVINAIGTYTIYSGSTMEPEVVQAMVDASHVMVKIRELNECAGELIAKYTHAEAGLVTAGAADAMLLQAAACIAGKDQAKIKRLPDTDEGMKNEFIISLKHENPFVHLWRGAGAKIVWVGSRTKDARNMRDCEIEAAINDKTVAIAFIATAGVPDSFDSLDKMVKVHRSSPHFST